MKPLKLSRAYRNRKDLVEILKISDSQLYRKMKEFQAEKGIELKERLLPPAIQAEIFEFLGFGEVEFFDE